MYEKIGRIEGLSVSASASVRVRMRCEDSLCKKMG